MATTTVLSWGQFEQLPDDPGKRELLEGELIELPPPKSRHYERSINIFIWLRGVLKEAHTRGEALSLGDACHERGFRLGARTWLQPDVSVPHRNQPDHDYMEGSPAIAIEIVSPANTPRALAIKTRLYFEFGALEVWHFFPDEGHVALHVADAEPVIIRDFIRSPLLPGFALDVKEMLRPTMLTWEQFEQLPDEPGKQELLEGELLEFPCPKFRHTKRATQIFIGLNAALEEAHARGEAPSLDEAYVEMGYKLGDRTWLRPEVSLTHPDQPVHDYMEGSPAIAIEIISPPNTPRVLAIKTRLYFEFGAVEIWRFYPEEGHVVVHAAGADPVIIRDFIRTPLLPGFALDVQEILRG
jgi:Uma2 family endonuclease